jgi:hypothetical protein
LSCPREFAGIKDNVIEGTRKINYAARGQGNPSHTRSGLLQQAENESMDLEVEVARARRDVVSIQREELAITS